MSKKISDRPWFPIYPGDWQKDLGLRMCSFAAKGLLMDMQCLMHQGNPYGYLRLTNKVITKVNLVHILGVNQEVVEPLLKELLDNEILDQDQNTKCYFYPEMIKREELRKKRAKGGKLGGNPALKETQNKKPEVNLKVGSKVNQSEKHIDNQGSDNDYVYDTDTNNEEIKTEIREEYLRKLKDGIITIDQFLEFSSETKLEKDAIEVLSEIKKINFPDFNPAIYQPKNFERTALIKFFLTEDYSKEELLTFIKVASKDDHWGDKISISLITNPRNLNILQTKVDRQASGSSIHKRTEFTEHAVGEVVG
jgi:predicted transcriptional regulator